jgi:hypothetical protein
VGTHNLTRREAYGWWCNYGKVKEVVSVSIRHKVLEYYHEQTAKGIGRKNSIANREELYTNLQASRADILMLRLICTIHG